MSVKPSSISLDKSFSTSKSLGEDQNACSGTGTSSDAPLIIEPERDTDEMDLAVSIKESEVTDTCIPKHDNDEGHSQFPSIQHAQEYQDTPVDPNSRLPYLKREADTDAEIVLPKRLKTKEVESYSCQSNAITTGFEDENLRENHEAKQRFLEEKIMDLEAQLQRTREHQGQQGTELAVMEQRIGDPDKVPEATSSNHGQHDINVLTRSLIDMSAEKSELRDSLRAKEEHLAALSKQLDDKKEELCNKDAELKAAECRVTAMAEDLHEQKQLRRSAKQARQAVELEKHVIGQELKETKEQLETLNRHHEKARTQDKNSLEKLKKQAKIDQTRIQTLQGMVVTREKKFTLQDSAMKMLEDNLSTLSKKTKEAEVKVEKLKAELHIEYVKVGELMAKNQELAAEAASVDGWKERLKNMFSAYEDVRAKNTTLIDKMEQVLQAGTFGDVSVKNRKMLDKLKSCPVEELAAYDEM